MRISLFFLLVIVFFLFYGGVTGTLTGIADEVKCFSGPGRTTLEDRKPHPTQVEMLPFVDDMLEHALHGYTTFAFPHDHLSPLTGSFKDNMGGYGVTLVDSLDTLALTRRFTQFRRWARWVEENMSFDRDVMVSSFETNIRSVGGLLSAHFMYEEGIVPIMRAEHDYHGGLLRLAIDLADRLLPAFDTPTGIPYGSVNLRHGVPKGEIDVSANACGGTFLLEFVTLSRITGDAKYEIAARRAACALFDLRHARTSLMGNHINISSGKWTLEVASVGTAIDSTIEYALKSHIMTGELPFWRQFEVYRRSSRKYLKRNGFYVEALMNNPYFLVGSTHNSLASFYPGLLELAGHHSEAEELIYHAHTIFKALGAIPEEYSIKNFAPHTEHTQYPLRPEHIESIYFLYRTTRDPAFLEMGKEVALALHLRTRTPFGFASLKDAGLPHGRHSMEDWMESFAISETLKYLYLLFDEENSLHRTCKDSGSHVGWVFTTEAHPLPNTAEWWPPSALHVNAAGKKGSGSGAKDERRMDRSAKALHAARLRHVRELGEQAMLGAVHSGDMMGRQKVEEEGGCVMCSYYCLNHAALIVDRLSSRILH